MIVILFAATLSVYAASLNSTPIQEHEYWQLVQSSRAAISNLDGLSNEETKKSLAELALQWEAVTEVNMSGQIIPVDNGWLIKLLRADEPNLKQIDGLLNTLLTAHEKQVARIPSTSSLDPLHTILARPEFTWAEPVPNPLNEWYQKILDALSKFLDRILGGNPLSVSVSTTTLSAIAAILLIVVLIFVFRNLYGDLIKEAQLNGEEDGSNEPLTSEAAFDKAQTLSRGGDYRSAVRYLYLSSLLLMDERGVLRYDRSKTNREYLRSVSNSPELSKSLGEVIEVFDNVWYGYHPLAEETFKQYSDRVEELKEKKS